VRDSVQFWHEADLSTYFCNVRLWGVEMPAIATGMGAKLTWPCCVPEVRSRHEAAGRVCSAWMSRRSALGPPGTLSAGC